MFSEKGQTILEVVVVVTVVILVVGALVLAVVFSLRNANFAKQQTQATKLAQEGLETLRTQRDRNGSISGIGISGVSSWNDDALWTNNVITNACPDKCYFRVTSGSLVGIGPGPGFPSGAETIGQFKRAIILEDEGNGTNAKKVTCVVQWKDSTGLHESRLSTVLRRL